MVKPWFFKCSDSDTIRWLGSDNYFSLLSNRHAEFMQNRLPVLSIGPSSKTWPKWLPQLAQVTSILLIPWELSSRKTTLPGKAWSKLGQPVLESNLALEENKGLPQAAHIYMPLSLVWMYCPVKGVSVPFSLKIRYCSGVSRFFHSSSEMLDFCLIFPFIKSKISYSMNLLTSQQQNSYKI